MLAPHGMPLDLLDRMMIIRTLPYSQEEMVQVIDIDFTLKYVQYKILLLWIKEIIIARSYNLPELRLSYLHWSLKVINLNQQFTIVSEPVDVLNK